MLKAAFWIAVGIAAKLVWDEIQAEANRQYEAMLP